MSDWRLSDILPVLFQSEVVVNRQGRFLSRVDTRQYFCGGLGAPSPGVVDHRIEVRKYLSVTISFDHDIIDGAPAARFIQKLKRLVESGDGIGSAWSS